MIQSRGFNVRPSLGSAIVGLLVFAVFVYILFKVAAFALKALALLGPVLLIAAFFVDRPTVMGYLRWIGGSLRTRPGFGIGLLLISLLAYPLVCGYLFAKALIRRRVGRALDDLRERAGRQASPFGGAAIGDAAEEYTVVERPDGVVIRIPREQGEEV